MSEVKRPQLPSREELEMIRDYVLLPMMMTIVTNNRDEIKRSTFSLRSYYAAAADALINMLHKDLDNVRKELKKRDIRVFEEEHHVHYSVDFSFNCRGYQDKFSIMREVVKAEISIRLGRYVTSLFKNKNDRTTTGR